MVQVEPHCCVIGLSEITVGMISRIAVHILHFLEKWSK